jgi:hypothetical protein
MTSFNEFVVDWPVSDWGGLPSDAAVEVRCDTRKIGLYRVKHLGSARMTLSHGGISFPEGTKLVIDDYQMLLPAANGPLVARVVQNDTHGIHVAW